MFPTSTNSWHTDTWTWLEPNPPCALSQLNSTTLSGGRYCPLPVHLETTSLNSRSQQRHAPFQGSEGESFPVLSSFWWLLVSPWLVVASLQPLPLSSYGLLPCVSVSPFLSLWGHSLDLGPTPNPAQSHLDPPLNYICNKPYFQRRLDSEVLDERGFLRDPAQPTTAMVCLRSQSYVGHRSNYKPCLFDSISYL